MATTLQAYSRTALKLKAKAELERRRRKSAGISRHSRRFDQYPFEPELYIQEWLGWTPWRGTAEAPGQADILDAYTLALRQLHEKDAWEQGEIAKADLQYWQPGQVIKNWIRVEAGHSTGKTKAASGIFSHFFDNFKPAIIYTFAPSYEQINLLLWKEIRVDRRGTGLPGRVLETPELKYKPNHFAMGRATNNSSDSGMERTQGQHGKYLLFILDEAVGIAGFVWDAVETMTSGGIVIVLMLANPRLRGGRFYKARESISVRNFRMSCLGHPNVLSGREIVPGAVRRDWVELMVEHHCDTIKAHDPDLFTFELPWQPGTIYVPNNEFLYRVLGIPPKNSADNTFIPVGRYEAAAARDPMPDKTDIAFMGADAARWGTDYGTLWVRYNGRMWRQAQFYKQDTFTYYREIRQLALQLHRVGVKKLHVRLDGTGGFAAGVVDQLNMDYELTQMFEESKVQEIHFGASASDQSKYANIVTEMYGEAAETVRGVAILDPPDELEDDLCDRHFKYVNLKGQSVKALEEKEKFRDRHGRSPDDGDGFVLAAAPEHLFDHLANQLATARPRVVKREEIFGSGNRRGNPFG